MPGGIRAPFEAYDIGIIRGETCRHLPQKERTLNLRLGRSVCYDRVDLRRRLVARGLGELLTKPKVRLMVVARRPG
jgi:hypothetical protein